MIPESIQEGLTFDDILLVPGRSSVVPAETDTRTLFTRKVPLNIPVTSSAMDTVTESHLAIALAREGGIGVVHKNMSIERQVEEVDKVKRSESGMIVDPVTIQPDQPISEAELQKLIGENIVAVRGKGLMWGIELDRPAGPVAAELLARGFVVGTAREKVIRLLPPYIVLRQALSEFISALSQIVVSSKEKAA